MNTQTNILVNSIYISPPGIIIANYYNTRIVDANHHLTNPPHRPQQAQTTSPSGVDDVKRIQSADHKFKLHSQPDFHLISRCRIMEGTCYTEKKKDS